MGDFYTEQLVKREKSGKSVLAKAGLVVLTVAALLLSFRIPFGGLLVIGLAVLDVVMFRRMDLEFEYLYVNGELDIDKIMAKSKRKRIFSTSVDELEVLAPTGSSELRLIKAEKTYDYSTLKAGNKTYELIVTQKGQKVKIIFEPNETILKGFKMLAPRKVFF